MATKTNLLSDIENVIDRSKRHGGRACWIDGPVYRGARDAVRSMVRNGTAKVVRRSFNPREFATYVLIAGEGWSVQSYEIIA